MKYIIGILAIAVGTLLVIKTEWFVENFGASDWAEAHLGSEGGSRLLYKLIGIAFIVLALMGVTGLLGNMILAIFGPMFGIQTPTP